LAEIFSVQRPAIVKHINNIYKSSELDPAATCSILEQVAADGKKRKMHLYYLDVIMSVDYKVNSTKATQFRQWATQRLKDYLIQGYAINEKRLNQKQQDVQTLKNGIRILSRAIETKMGHADLTLPDQFAKGLELLDDYDHEKLDSKGRKVIFPTQLKILRGKFQTVVGSYRIVNTYLSDNLHQGPNSTLRCRRQLTTFLLYHRQPH
jgi:hypothetical protein